MSRLKTRTVTIVNREKTGEDTYGNDVLDDVETVETGWNVQPRTSSENVEARQQVVSGFRAFAPLDSVVTATSAVLVDGLRYEVDGDVGPWKSSTTAGRGHLELNLKRVTG